MAAIGSANQLASQQAHQPVQIRTMFTAQQNAEAACIAAELDAEAKGEAMEERMRKRDFQPGSPDRY